MKKSIFTLGLLFFFMSGYSASANKEVGNGGDICEKSFLTVRDDISSWIGKGGSAGLEFPSEISQERYDTGMLQMMRKASVSCTTEAVLIGAAEKTCKNFEDENGDTRVLCNVKRFLETSASDQYVLVHHEYAGLAGIEVNAGEESRYSLSKQISGFLENQVIKKLAISRPISLTRYCSIDGHESDFIGKLRHLINLNIDNLKKQGIEVDPSTVDYQLSIRNKFYKTHINGNAYILAEGGFKSRRGTVFVVQFEYYRNDSEKQSDLRWEWNLVKNGVDSEGNAINPHCDMSPGWQGHGMVTFVNADSGTRVAAFPLGKIRLF